MITFTCVWAGEGAPYSEEWVQKLKRGIERHYPRPHKFVCLTDRDHIEGVDTIKLDHNWPIYWSKMELFKPGQFSGPVVYMDLDVLITGDISEFVREWESMVMITDYYPEIDNSTMMYWNSDDEFYHGMYHDMVANSEQIQHDYRNRWPVKNFGDQEYIGEYIKRNGRQVLRWQDVLPKEWFVEFSIKSALNPIVRDKKYSNDLRFCYCLGAPKFQLFRKLPIVRDNWI